VRLRGFQLARLSPPTVGLGCGFIVGMAVVVGQWLFNYFGFRRIHGIGIVGPIISFVVASMLVGTLQLRALQRRRARLARAQVVADCNHEIRNALQAMVGLHYPQEGVEQIQAAVRRIDWALRDLLPHVQDDDEEQRHPPLWEIQSGRLRVKGHSP